MASMSSKRNRDVTENACSSQSSSNSSDNKQTCTTDRHQQNIPLDVREWSVDRLTRLSVLSHYQPQTTPLQLLKMFPPDYYSLRSESLRTLSHYSLPFLIDDIEVFINEYCDFTLRLDDDINSMCSTSANILRHRKSLYESPQFLARIKCPAKKQNMVDWLRRFETCGLNFGQKLYYMVKKRELQETEDHRFQFNPLSEHDFQFLFEAFVSMFGLKSYDWFDPLIPWKILRLDEAEVCGKPNILYCQDLDCEPCDDVEKAVQVVAVCEVKKCHMGTDMKECNARTEHGCIDTEDGGVRAGDGCIDTKDGGVRAGDGCSSNHAVNILPPHISTSLLGHHGGNLLLYYNQSVQKGVIFGLIVQETKVTFTALQMTEEQYKNLRAGKLNQTPARMIVTRAYDFMKKEDRKHLIRPLLELAVMQEVKVV